VGGKESYQESNRGVNLIQVCYMSVGKYHNETPLCHQFMLIKIKRQVKIIKKLKQERIPHYHLYLGVITQKGRESDLVSCWQVLTPGNQMGSPETGTV
jgi:hypothetical protein